MMIPEMMPNEYIAMYAKPNTRYQKQFAIRRFLRLYLDHDVPDLNPAMQEYLQRDDKQVLLDLVGYHTHPSIQRLAPKTRSLYTSLVITYFEDCCGLRMSNLQRKMARKSMAAEKVRAVTINANPTREMIRTILQHCNERHTAEILISVSSGMRFGEILQLEHSDIDYTTSPATIHVRGETTKTGDPRTTYLSAEAVDAVKSYYRVRDAMIQIQSHHNRRPQSSGTTDNLVFPWSQTNEGALILRSIKSAGYTERDKRTGRYRVHFHILRAFFLTQAKRRAGAPFVEAWAGHAGYLTASYHRPSVEEDRAEYLKCEPDLTINIPDDYLAIKVQQATEIQELQTTAANQQRVIQDLIDEIHELRRARIPKEDDWVGYRTQ